MHTRLLACTRRPEVLRALAHVYVPQRSFSQLTLLLNQSKDSGEGKKSSWWRRRGRNRDTSNMDDASRLKKLEIQVWGLLGQQTQRRQEIKTQMDALRTEIGEVRKLVKKPETTKPETTKKGVSAPNPPGNQSNDTLKKEIEEVRKLAKGANTLAEMLKNGLANTKERHKEITEELGVIFKQSKLLQLQCKAALLKQVPKTLLRETPPSSTASIPDMLLSNRDRYSEVGLSSPEQMDWISAQWKIVFDEPNIDVEPLSLYSIFTILKHLKKEEKAVYSLIFQHCSGKRFIGWSNASTQEEKDEVLVP